MAIVAPERIIAVRLKASDETRAAVETAKQNLKGLGTQSQSTVSAMQSHWNGMRISYLKVAAAVTGIMLTLRKAWDAAGMTAQFFEQQAALDALGKKWGMTGQQIVAATQKASAGLVSMKDAADVAAKAMSKGFSPKQLTEMTKVAERMSNVFQGDIAQSVEAFATAVQGGMMRSLRQNFGIVVDLDAVYKKYAATLGINASQLDESTKRQLRYNAVMGAAAVKVGEMGEATESIDDKMQKFRARMSDLSLFLGQLSIRFFAFLQTIFGAVVGAVEAQMAFWLKPFAWVENQLEKFGVTFTDRFFNTLQFKMEANSKIMFDQMKEGWSIMTASVEELSGAGAAAVQDMTEDVAQSESELSAKIASELQRRFDIMNEAFNRQKELGRQRVEADNRVQDILLELHGTEFDRRREEINAEFAMLREHADNKIALEIAYQEALKQLRHEERQAEKDAAAEAKARKFEEMDAKKAIVQDAMGAFAGMFNTLAQIEGKHQKAAFAAFKAFAIAEAIIDAHRAFSRALATLPPPFSYIAAASAFATAIARVAAIAATQPTGGGGGGGAPAAAAPPQPNMNAMTPTAPVNAGTVVNFYIAGNLVNMDELGRELVPSIQRAIADGVA